MVENLDAITSSMTVTFARRGASFTPFKGSALRLEVEALDETTLIPVRTPVQPIGFLRFDDRLRRHGVIRRDAVAKVRCGTEDRRHELALPDMPETDPP